MARKIYFESLKGGTGVTTVCVGLGLALADMGEKILLVDGDGLTACAMIIAGLGNMQVYTLADYEKAACRAKQAAVTHPKANNLHIMPSLGLKDRTLAKRAVEEIEGLFDIILLDKIAPECCGEAVIVTEPYLPSIKSADCCKAKLTDEGFKICSIIVNKINGGQVLNGEILPAEQISDILRLKLLAQIPEDATISAGKWRPQTVNAFKTAAEALTGKNSETYDVLRHYTGINGFIKRKMRERL